MTSSFPDFIVIGGMKCGTSAFYRYLRTHPEIFLPRKNLDFFNAQHWERGLDWYRAQFGARTSTHKVAGDVSTEYAKYPFRRGAPERMAVTLPRVKLIYLVRHPVQRIVSQYIHLINELTEDRPFSEAVAGESNEYVTFSRYHLQMKQFLTFYRREDILLLQSEQLRHSPLEILNETYRFLGVSEVEAITPVSANTREEKRQWNAIGRLVRRNPQYFDRLGYYLSRLPRPVSNLVLGSLSSPIRVSIPRDDLIRLARVLEPDVKRFYALVGPEFSRWDLTEE